MASPFPSMKDKRLLRLLRREFGYEVERQQGTSHRRLVAPDWPALSFAFHHGVEVPSVAVREILVSQVGLSVEEALEVVRRA